jgi:hypothetical protein
MLDPRRESALRDRDDAGNHGGNRSTGFVDRREPGNPLNLLSYLHYLKYRFKIENSHETALLPRLSGRDQQVTLATLGR